MTAEIAILNRSAVALAADSAVTLESQTAIKTYNTVNKLFTLSKQHPVGIMLYQNADFMDIPWETIIKIFRKRLGYTEYPTIRDYAKAFIHFLATEIPSNGERQADRIFGIWYTSFEALNKRVRKALGLAVQLAGHPLSPEDARDVTKAVVRNERDRLLGLPDLNEFASVVPDTIVVKYLHEYEEALSKNFKGRPLTDQTRKLLREIAGLIITKQDFSPIMSGIVIAGFGGDEYFPSLYHFKTDGVIDGRLIMHHDQYTDISREADERASILAFAQKEMVHRFMDGIDFQYLYAFQKSIEELMDKFSSDIIKRHVTKPSNIKKSITTKAKKAARLMLGELMKEHERYRHSRFVEPVMRAVQLLPKEEMAELAESLVSITSLKRRMSFEVDSVGGPIDVAVISKGDGFVWIKRKHYFDIELNPHFINNYFSDLSSEGGSSGEQTDPDGQST